jgi:hypothetical protein
MTADERETAPGGCEAPALTVEFDIDAPALTSRAAAALLVLLQAGAQARAGHVPIADDLAST